MKDSNYILLKDFPTVQFIGFPKLTAFAIITIPQSKNTVIVETKDLPLRPNRFRIDIRSDRTALSARLFHLINHHDLENKHFIYNQFMKNYFASDIKVP